MGRGSKVQYTKKKSRGLIPCPERLLAATFIAIALDNLTERAGSKVEVAFDGQFQGSAG
jgi:hypothetical protein